MPSPTFDNIHPGDLQKLSKMETIQEVAQYFPEDSKVAQVTEGVENEYRVSGVLKSGVVEGGQAFSMKLKLMDVDVGGLYVPVWEMQEVVVCGVDISAELTVPAYISRRYLPPVEPEDLATYDQMVANVSAFTLTGLGQIHMPEFSTADNFFALLHENGHNKSIPFLRPGEYREISKFHQLVDRIMSSPDPAIAAQTVFDDAIKRGHLEGLRDLARSDYLWEMVSSQYSLDFIINHPDAGWFTTDTDLYRVKNLLNTMILSYHNFFNQIFGAGTISSETVNFQPLPSNPKSP